MMMMMMVMIRAKYEKNPPPTMLTVNCRCVWLASCGVTQVKGNPTPLNSLPKHFFLGDFFVGQLNAHKCKSIKHYVSNMAQICLQIYDKYAIICIKIIGGFMSHSLTNPFPFNFVTLCSSEMFFSFWRGSWRHTLNVITRRRPAQCGRGCVIANPAPFSEHFLPEHYKSCDAHL